MKVFLILLVSITTACVGYEQTVQDAIAIGQASLAPTPSESSSAAKQALDKGVQTGIQLLQKDGGFSQSIHKILIPPELQKASEIARSLGLQAQVNNFEKSLNRAAEESMTAALPIFKNAINQLTFQDVVAIMTGGDQAATQFFRSKSERSLHDAFRPIVARTTQKNNVGKLYKDIMTTVKPAAALAGVTVANVDLDDYVSQKAATALFAEIGKQEKKIRENPIERSTALLQKVFGYYGQKRS